MLLIGFGGEDADFADDLPDDIPDDIAMDAGTADAVDSAHGHVMDHGSSWLFGAISLRTLVAATLFFGLCGIAAQQAGTGDALAFLIALAGGSAALFGVHFIMKTLYRLGQDSTVRIERAVGRRAAVYVPIPPHKSGIGKIQIKLQDRLMEYAAMTTAADKIPTGARVEVVSLVSPTTLEVQPLSVSKPAKEA
jgi:membrane protein implicated in regulation of membrane protease activity